MLNTLTPIYRFCFQKTLTPRARNQVGFLRLIKPALGPLVEMSAEQKLAINREIDLKMKELESTGLSREELLLTESRKGIPLASDPFFQYLKRNYLAREIYIKAGERYTAEKVIEIALQQNIGPDPSYANIRQPMKRTTVVRMEDTDDQRAPQPGEFKAPSYNANVNFQPIKLKDELKHHQDIKYIYTPMEKYEKIKVKTRVLRHYDIHWRNVELITQFLTRSGNIKSRFNTCLPFYQQKKMEKAIKAARSMFLIPHYGRVQLPMNRNLTSLEDEVNQIGKKQINLDTGHMYVSSKIGIEAKEELAFKQNDSSERWEKIKKEGPHYKLWLDSLKDDYVDENFERMAKAQSYARHLKKKQLLTKGIDISKEDDQIYATEVEKRLGLRRNKPRALTEEEEKEAKVAYEQEQKRMMEASVYDFAELLIKEKTI